MIPSLLRDRLRLPAIVSPMFLVSGPDLVVEACRNGLVGSFPSLNQRTAGGCESWLREIRSRLGADVPPFAMQFAIHSTHGRLKEDMELLIRYEVPVLISTLGITREVVDAVHAYGGLVFHDAINVRHAQRALDAGVDGVIAVCAGAGGHAGTYNPFAFAAELRPLMGEKCLILAGCIGDGHALAGAVAAGADLGYIGTRFVATSESIASDKMKRMTLEADISDIVYSAEVDGIGANWLKQTMPAKSLLGDGQPGKLDVDAVLGDHKRWRDILSVGQGVGMISDMPKVADLVSRFEQQFHNALARVRNNFPNAAS